MPESEYKLDWFNDNLGQICANLIDVDTVIRATRKSAAGLICPAGQGLRTAGIDDYVGRLYTGIFQDVMLRLLCSDLARQTQFRPTTRMPALFFLYIKLNILIHAII